MCSTTSTWLTRPSAQHSSRHCSHSNSPCGRRERKEQALLDLIGRELGQRRKVLVYAQHTDSRDVTARLVRLLAERTIKAAVLHSSVEAKGREAWVEGRLKEGVQVLLPHPKCVQMG
jgi:Lhr-like helicase